jgi:hypothetical protein
MGKIMVFLHRRIKMEISWADEKPGLVPEQNCGEHRPQDTIKNLSCGIYSFFPFQGANPFKLDVKYVSLKSTVRDVTSQQFMLFYRFFRVNRKSYK